MMNFIIDIKSKQNNILIFCAFFSLVLSSVQTYYQLKYIGLIILLVIIIFDLKYQPANRNQLIIATLIIITAALSLMFQQLTIEQSIWSILYYIVLIMISIWGYRIFKTRKEIIAGTLAIIIGVIIVLLTSKSEILYQYSILRIYTGRLRVYGKFNHANTFGYICAIVVIALFSLKNSALIISKVKKRLWVITLLIFTSFLILSDSRGAIVFATVFIFFFMSFKWMQNCKLSSNAKVSIISLAIIVLGTLAICFISRYIFQQETYASRLAANSEIGGNILEVLFGRGMVASNSIDYSKITGYLEIAWLNMYYKAGVLGVLNFLGIFVFLGLESQKRKESKSIATALLFSVLITTFVESITVNIFNLVPIFIWPLLSSFCQSDGIIEVTNNMQ